MHKSRITLNLAQIRKNNHFLRNCADRQESDNLHDFIKSHLITTSGEYGKRVVLKGTLVW